MRVARKLGCSLSVSGVAAGPCVLGAPQRLKTKISEDRYDFITEAIEGMELDALWLYVQDDGESFEERRDIFFTILRRLLADGSIELIHFHRKTPMGGDIDDQIKRFMEAFPIDIEGVNDGFWFFEDDCPGASAWLR